MEAQAIRAGFKTAKGFGVIQTSERTRRMFQTFCFLKVLSVCHRESWGPMSGHCSTRHSSLTVSPSVQCYAFGSSICLGPLPGTRSGNRFLLTLMCVATCFPEAVPLRKIIVPTINKALIKFVFTIYALPKIVKSDQGTNFQSKTFKPTLQSSGISHSIYGTYHPRSQGALEHWHQTLKSMLTKFCHATGRDWNESVPFVPFAIKDARQESLGFSPAELVFGHNVCGPLKVMKEQFVCSASARLHVSDFGSQCRERLRVALLATQVLFLSGWYEENVWLAWAWHWCGGG